MEASQFKTIAELSDRFADGTVEVTSRANLQLRAIKEENLPEIAREISSAGLLPSPRHDRVRNIVTCPLAGLNLKEFLDTRPLVLELDRRLRAESLFAELHPKFSFGLHGDLQRFTRDLDDLSLEACEDDSHLRLYLAGVATDCSVTSTNAVDCLIEAARFCIKVAKEAGVPIRAKRIVALPGAIDRLIDSVGPMLMPCSTTSRLPAFVEAPQGVSSTGRGDLVNIMPSIPLGRLTSQQASAIADVSSHWDGDLRLAPWRGVVLGSMPATAAEEIVELLRSTGLSCDGRDGFRGIAACAGSTGCDASLADVRGDAVLLAQRLAGRHVPLGWTVNLSGCEKQCARRHIAAAELIADGSGYLVRINGQPVGSSCSAESAIEAVAAFHTQRLSEVAAL